MRVCFVKRVRSPVILAVALLICLWATGAALATERTHLNTWTGVIGGASVEAEVKEIFVTSDTLLAWDADLINHQLPPGVPTWFQGAGVNLFEYVVISDTDTPYVAFGVSNPAGLPAVTSANKMTPPWLNPLPGSPVLHWQTIVGNTIDGQVGEFFAWSPGVDGVTTGTLTGLPGAGTLTGPTTGPTPPVPEPATLSLLALGAAGLLPLLRRRR